MIDVPEVTPLTIPVIDPIVAAAIVELAHVPPLIPSVRLAVPPRQTVGSAGVIAVGAGYTVTVLNA